MQNFWSVQSLHGINCFYRGKLWDIWYDRPLLAGCLFPYLVLLPCLTLCLHQAVSLMKSFALHTPWDYVSESYIFAFWAMPEMAASSVVERICHLGEEDLYSLSQLSIKALAFDSLTVAHGSRNILHNHLAQPSKSPLKGVRSSLCRHDRKEHSVLVLIIPAYSLHN